MVSQYHVDEAFGPVPLWLLRSKVSDRAVRLYALLSALSDATGVAVGRKELANDLRCSLDSLDRAKTELEEVGAVTITRGHDENGGLARNAYAVHHR